MSCSRFTLLFSCAVLLLFTRCGDGYAFIDSQVVSIAKARRIDDTIMKDIGANFEFSRLRKPATFGLSLDYKVPESNQGKETYVVVSGRMRTNYAQSGAVIAVVTHKDQEQLSWMVIPVKYHITDLNTWCPFRDSVRLPETLDGKKYNLITTVAHLATSAKENFDIDTLRIALLQKL